MEKLKSRQLLVALAVAMLLLLSITWFSCETETQNMTAPPTQARLSGKQGADIRDLSQVMRIQTGHTKTLLEVTGVVGTATTVLPDGRYAIKIYTEKPGMEKFLPELLAGVPVIVENCGAIHAQDYAPADRIRPVPCGVSGHNIGLRPPGPNGAVCFMGTIACVVEKNGDRYFLSNNHIFARANRGRPGEAIVQPVPGDHEIVCAQDENDIVVELAEFEKIKWLHTREYNTIDAAIAKILYNVTFTCSMLNDLYTPGNNPEEAYLGMKVKKVGRSYGLTGGEVNALNATIVVSYEPDGYAVFENQVGYTRITISGDSGSLVVTDDSHNNPVVLHFADSSTGSFGNPIQAVLDYFGVTICGD